jgi:uncharacterized membrane protein HdeD (DUF308 family)
MTRRQFYKSEEMTPIRKQINTCAICAYVCAGISLIAGILLLGNASIIIDVALVVICGVLIHVLQSRAAAIVLTVYAVINVVVGLLSTGKLQGWWLCIIGVYSIIHTFKFQKAWKEFKASPEAQML